MRQSVVDVDTLGSLVTDPLVTTLGHGHQDQNHTQQNKSHHDTRAHHSSHYDPTIALRPSLHTPSGWSFRFIVASVGETVRRWLEALYGHTTLLTGTYCQQNRLWDK